MISTGIQSVWFNHVHSKVDYACGWISPEFHLLSWSLSCLQLAKILPEVILITDETGNYLSYELDLPYSDRRVCLELNDRSTPFWVLNKIYSYSLQEKPFIHVDTDFYFFNNPFDELIPGFLIAQNYEYNHPYYIDAIEKISKFPELPNYLKNIDLSHVSAVNAGIIGGYNTDFFKEFNKYVNQFVDENRHALSIISLPHLNIFLEQYLFKRIADWQGIPITYLLKDKIGYPYNYRLDCFADLPGQCNCIHVMNYKRNPTVCEQLAQRLWLESPELYDQAQKVSRSLKSTHHPTVSPISTAPNPFYRTQYVLSSLRSFPRSPLSFDDLSAEINAISDETPKAVLTDGFEYEQRRQAFIDALPDATALKHAWQAWSISANALLSLPFETYYQRVVRLGDYCQRIDSEWNWAEVNEFAGQNADRDFAANLRVAPAYFEAILSVYLHLGVVREQLLDAINILLFDALEEPAAIAVVIENVCEQVRQYQPSANPVELNATILGRIRHFLYQGVLVVCDE